MADTSSVVFVSCTNESARRIIQTVAEESGDGEFHDLEPGLSARPWHISTKYYEVDIRLCAMANKSLSSEAFASTVEGLVIYFDSEAPGGLEAVEGWYSFLKEYGAEVKILLCRRCLDTSERGVDRVRAQEWCVREGFELVELDPRVDEEWEAEQDFHETTGARRIWQALEAHVWPNLQVKEREEPKTMSALLNGGLCRSTGSFYDAEQEAGTDNIEPDAEELLEREETEFMELFSQLASMKERAATMSSDDKKNFAEQVVLAYWRAMGGDDEEEILDI